MASSDYSSTSAFSSKYDIIIVGGGTAGLTLATRLSEEPQLNILVLEAGANRAYDPAVLNPGLSPTLTGNPTFDWEFETTPQEAYSGRIIIQSRGKGLGGTSAISRNMMTFPSSSCLNTWSDLGSKGWDYTSMLPYLQKFHTFHEPSKSVSDILKLDYMDVNLHGKTGPIKVTFGEYHTEFDKAWAETFGNLGYRAKCDPLTGRTEGGHNVPTTIDHDTMTRSHSGNSYLTSAVLKRPNLHVVTEVLVESVVLEKGNEGIIARDVCVSTKSGERETVYGTEVVLCAGAIQSPQILELSGIGSASLLKGHGITPVVNNPHVGENLQDHAMVAVSFESKIPTFDSFRGPEVAGAAFKGYEEKRSGPMTWITIPSAFMSMTQLGGDTKSQIQQLLDDHLKYDSISFPSQKAQFELIREILEDPSQSSIQYLMAPVQVDEALVPANVNSEARLHDYTTLFASLAHPFSRGSVHINSPIITAKPTVDPKYFTHPLDVEILARHIQYFETIVGTKPLKSLLKSDGLRIPPNSRFKTVEDAKKLIEFGFTSYHPCGTCAMMPQDLGGVVDENLRVYGVNNLRIVDASIFPLIPRGNILSCVYAVAEKAADLIKEGFRRAQF